MQVTLEVPESALSVLRVEPGQFAKEALLAAVAMWYEAGMISQSKASEIAGISRHAFLEVLYRYGVSPFQDTPEEIEGECSLGGYQKCSLR